MNRLHWAHSDDGVAHAGLEGAPPVGKITHYSGRLWRAWIWEPLAARWVELPGSPYLEADGAKAAVRRALVRTGLLP